MGCFDNIEIDDKWLPDSCHGKHNWQTKDLDCGLSIYHIDSNGVFDYPSIYTGDLYFYDGIEFVAKIEAGMLKSIKSVTDGCEWNKINTHIPEFNVELAIELSKYVHDYCNDAPHDIGVNLAIIAKRFYDNV